MSCSRSVILSQKSSKNSSLGIMAAALLARGRTVLHNVPRISDVFTMVDMLQRIGAEVRINANVRAYTRPLAILVDAYSASSSELLATMLREQRGAYIVGRPSCGCVVAVRGSGYRLAGGGPLYVAETGFVTPQGNKMEGAGIRPDREVALTLADLSGRVDRDIVDAREWLMRQAHRSAEAVQH